MQGIMDPDVLVTELKRLIREFLDNSGTADQAIVATALDELAQDVRLQKATSAIWYPRPTRALEVFAGKKCIHQVNNREYAEMIARKLEANGLTVTDGPYVTKGKRRKS